LVGYRDIPTSAALFLLILHPGCSPLTSSGITPVDALLKRQRSEIRTGGLTSWLQENIGSFPQIAGRDDCGYFPGVKLKAKSTISEATLATVVISRRPT
jgi:hypothetical protein